MASLGTSLVMPVALLHPGFGEGLLTGFGEGLLTPPKRSTEGLLIRRETFGSAAWLGPRPATAAGRLPTWPQPRHHSA